MKLLISIIEKNRFSFKRQYKRYVQAKFHPGMRFYLFHPEKKFMSKQNFFHLRTSFDDISSRLHVKTTLN